MSWRISLDDMGIKPTSEFLRHVDKDSGGIEHLMRRVLIARPLKFDRAIALGLASTPSMERVPVPWEVWFCTVGGCKRWASVDRSIDEDIVEGYAVGAALTGHPIPKLR